ncbi:MAG TPA: hypothetical protein VHE59_07065 [Mucilaginibacter sp.]|nr:hypothetical protein [Mucilaginibacter sp.]
MDQMAPAAKMTPYLSDHVTGVAAYLFAGDSIILKFRSRDEFYLYTDKMPGAEHVKTMKKLAKKGSGLTTYINQNVRERYFKRSLDIKELIELAT